MYKSVDPPESPNPDVASESSEPALQNAPETAQAIEPTFPTITGGGTSWQDKPQPAAIFYEPAAFSHVYSTKTTSYGGHFLPQSSDMLYARGAYGGTNPQGFARQQNTIEHPQARPVDPRTFSLRYIPDPDHCSKCFMCVYSQTARPDIAARGTQGSRSSITVGSQSQYVSQSWRRFVVVREGDLSCSCLPIHTYEGRATLKPSANPDTHAVIYVRGKEPWQHERERLILNPVEVEPVHEVVTLQRTSRINFDKVYRVEHNLPVIDIGDVRGAYLDRLQSYYSQIFERKPSSGRSNAPVGTNNPGHPGAQEIKPLQSSQQTILEKRPSTLHLTTIHRKHRRTE